MVKKIAMQEDIHTEKYDISDLGVEGTGDGYGTRHINLTINAAGDSNIDIDVLRGELQNLGRWETLTSLLKSLKKGVLEES